MDRAAKLRKLDDFRRRVPHVSASALSAIIAELRDDPLEVHDRNSIRDARDQRVTEVTPYGTVLTSLPIECVDGTYTNAIVANIFALLYVAARDCRGFAYLIKKTFAERPCTYENPWSFVLYSDEVVPGNQLSFSNLRKSWVLYFSFLEFGTSILSMEDAWFCLSNERSSNVKKYKGGIAQLFGALLRFIFTGTSHTLQNSGVRLDLADGTTIRIFAKMHMILQDGGAHKLVYMVKGESGHKFCMCCKNLYTATSEIANGEDDEENILTCSLLKERDLDFATDEDIRGTVRRLAHFAATVEKKTLVMREQAAGFNHHPFNMLLDPALDDVLKPISHFAHDWMHTFCVHGVWNTILFLMLQAAIACGVKDAPRQLETYVSQWTVPLRLGLHTPERLCDTFSKSRWKSSKAAKYMKCTASDALSVYSIVACYVHAVFLRAGRAPLACKAYLAVCDVLDLLVAVPRGVVTPEMLSDAIDVMLNACIAAGWTDNMPPKFHWCIHLPHELRRFLTLLSCWVHERKHRMVKRYSNDVHNTKTFEKTILSEVTCHHFSELVSESKFELIAGLVPPIRAAGARMVAFLKGEFQLGAAAVRYTTSTKARVSKFEVCWQRDVVLYHDDGKLICGEVFFFAACNDISVALISAWQLESEDIGQGSITARIEDGNAMLVPIDSIETSCTYRRKSDGRAQVIVPSIFRGRVS